MKTYIKNYFDFFGYTTADTILCEVCGNPSNSIHHVIPRSHFGKKRKDEQDNVNNLISLCFSCHDKVHCRDSSIKEKINEIMKQRLIKSV